MLKIVDERCSGNTSKLCRYALDNECDIIVPNRYNVEHVLKELRYQADRNGYKIFGAVVPSLYGGVYFNYNGKTGDVKTIHISAISDVIEGCIDYESQPRKVVVDEVERCMAMLLSTYGYNYQGFTMGLEE